MIQVDCEQLLPWLKNESISQNGENPKVQKWQMSEFS